MNYRERKGFTAIQHHGGDEQSQRRVSPRSSVVAVAPDKQGNLIVEVRSEDGGRIGNGGPRDGPGGPSGSDTAGSFSWHSALASEIVYCLVSAGTILFNKHALSTFQFPAPNMLLFFQFLEAVVLLKLAQVFGLVHLEPLRWHMVKMWFPINLIFVAMNVTGFYALRSVGAGMFTVLKNLSNLLTIAGDYVLFGNTYSWQVWLCLLLMIGSALLGAWTDLSFSLSGYSWQLVNCFFTAAYSLYLSGVIKKASKPSHDKAQLSELSMVYYNNLLSIIPLALLVIVFGEAPSLRTYPHLHSVEFQVVAVLGGLLGFGVSFASIWCVSRTSATLYSLTGSMNKVIVALVGMWYFQEAATLLNIVSIAAGIAAGILFVFSKQAAASAAAGAGIGAAGAGGSGSANSGEREGGKPG